MSGPADDQVDEAMRQLGMLPLAARDRGAFYIGHCLAYCPGTTVSVARIRDILGSLFQAGVQAGRESLKDRVWPEFDPETVALFRQMTGTGRDST